MLHLLLSTALLLSCPAAQQAPDGVQMIRMHDGRIVWGTIRAHDPEALEIVLLEHGGVARLPWSLLDPAQESELRRRFGYVDEAGEELLVDAERLLLADGREVVGKILGYGDDAILVKTAGATISVPKNRIAAPATAVRVPALEIFTREELYNQELARSAPDDARAQFALAQHCERILDFAHAVEHYTAAQQLDPAYRADDVRWALQRARQKAEHQEQVDYLSAVDLLAARRKFDEALARAEAFAEVYPDSPLQPDAARKIQRVEKARERALRELVVKSWHSAASRLARDAAAKPFVEVLAYLDETMAQQVFEAVVEEARKASPEIEPETVRKLWLERQDGRYRKASYGYGTWLLGEDAALKGMEEEGPAPEDEPATDKDKQRAELEQRVKRYLENQQLQQKSRTSEAQAEDREEAWKALSAPARQSWILAYYAEQSGDMQLREKPYFRLCEQCGGKGLREIIETGNARTRQGDNASGSGIKKEPCASCRTIGVVRAVAYR